MVIDKGGKRGDFGIHLDVNAPASLDCIVMNGDRFKDFEEKMNRLKASNVTDSSRWRGNLATRALLKLPLFITYS